ncbi:MAG: MBL fold metallo-hydrolase [Planctomycetota bacterium]
MAKQRIASAVAITRGAGAQIQVYLVERAPELRFFGGYWALPGGVVEADDGAPDLDETLVACAVRELQEEIVVDLPPPSLRKVCDITTPPFAPVRYATRFLHAELPAGQEPQPQPGELVGGRFWDPSEALAAWRRGEMRIVPPVLLLLELLQESSSIDEFLQAADAEGRALAAGKLHPVRFSPGIFLAPLTTRTKPPATTTNTFLVGEERVYIVDPAPVEAAEQQRLFDKIDQVRAAGAELAGIILTHHHPDHIGAVVAVADRYELPVLAHDETFARLPFEVPTKQRLADGDRLELGAAPDESPGWQLEVYHTPGHAPGHLALRDSRYNTLIAGDLCSTISSILIEPGDGHLATYLASLQRLLDLPLDTIYPSHGPAHRDAGMVLRKTIQHRHAREQKLIDALKQGHSTTADLVPVVYDDTDPALHAMAGRSLAAGLAKLVEEGRVAADADGWHWR